MKYFSASRYTEASVGALDTLWHDGQPNACRLSGPQCDDFHHHGGQWGWGRWPVDRDIEFTPVRRLVWTPNITIHLLSVCPAVPKPDIFSK